MRTRPRQRICMVLLLWVAALAMACGRAGGDAVTPSNPPSSIAPASALPPCEGDAFSIDLIDAIDAMPDDTLDAQREQLRDWIWTVALGRIARQTSVDNVFAGVADQPVIRDDALAHVLRQPVGPTRAVTTKGGEVIVLVDAGAAQNIDAEVVEAIDDESLSLGRTPERVLVYGYELKPSTAEAAVCRIGKLDRETLESATRAFRHAVVSSAADLEQFLSGGVDLLSAQCSASGLEVTGRQRPRSTKAEVTVEHVAALAQELGVRYVPTERFGVTLTSLPDELRADIKERGRRLDAVLASGALTTEALRSMQGGLDQETLRFLNSIVAWKRENPAAGTTELLLSYELQRRLEGKPGFSLDPVVDARATSSGLNELINALPNLGDLERVLRGWGDDRRAESIRGATPDQPTLQAVRGRLVDLRARFPRLRDEHMEEALLTPMPGDSLDAAIASELLRSVYQHSTQQCARYDGPLAGTATGMTFFYTDLLSKLWAIDWRGTAPESSIDGFESVIHHAGSTAWCGEEDRPSMRTWFGVRDEAYARDRSGVVRFAPTAARIFAKGSTPGSGEGEVEPPAFYRRFIRWWDTHYTRVAAWEPQYEVLNQLMKWSVVTQNARITGARGCLGFLADMPVTSDRRFDRWVSERPELKWHGPVTLVRAHPKVTECLPLLTSEAYRACGMEATLTGGVGAASIEEVRAKPFRSEETPIGLGRLGGDAKPVVSRPDRLRFEKVQRSGGELRGVEIEGSGARLTFRANIDPAASQRGSLSSNDPRTPVLKVAKGVEADGSRLKVHQHSNGILGGEILASDLERAQVHVEVKPGEVGEAKLLGQRIQKRMTHDGVSLAAAAGPLALDHEVQRLDDGQIAVRLRAVDGREAYAVMSSGSGNRGPPGAHIGLVVGVPGDEPHNAKKYYDARSEPVRVQIVSGPGARAYLDEHSGTPLRLSDATWEAVKAKVDGGDLAGALATFERQPTGPAARLLLAEVLARADVTSADRVVTASLRLRSSEDLADLERVVDEHSVMFARKGGNQEALSQLSVKISIGHRGLLVSGGGDRAAAEAAAQGASIYAPTTTSIEGRLPPAAHQPGKRLPPNEQYISRIVELADSTPLPPAIKLLDGDELRRISPQGEPSGERRTSARTSAQRSSRRVGSSYRLLRPTRPVVIVQPCSDADASKPPCHAPPSPIESMASAMLEEAVARDICAAGAEGDLSSPQLRACREQVHRCMYDANGLRPVSEGRVCLDALRKERRPSGAASTGM